jgi:hypothetical protein
VLCDKKVAEGHFFYFLKFDFEQKINTTFPRHTTK